MARKHTRPSGSYARDIDEIQLRAILDTISMPRDRILVQVLYEAICTVSELADIKVEDISSGSIMIGRQKRKVEISSELSDEISSYLQGRASGFLFSSRQSPRMDTRRIQQIIKKHLGIASGRLRHTRIAELATVKGIGEALSRSGLKVLKTKSFLNEGEIKRLQKIIKDNKDSIIFNLLLETGCLISELVELKISDIRGNSVSLGDPKRQIRISGKLAAEIREVISNEHIAGFLFATRQSERISDKRVFQILKEYGKADGIRINPRIIRNTKIAGMLQSGKKSQVNIELGIKRLEFSSYGLLEKNG